MTSPGRERVCACLVGAALLPRHAGSDREKVGNLKTLPPNQIVSMLRKTPSSLFQEGGRFPAEVCHLASKIPQRQVRSNHQFWISCCKIHGLYLQTQTGAKRCCVPLCWRHAACHQVLDQYYLLLLNCTLVPSSPQLFYYGPEIEID